MTGAEAKAVRVANGMTQRDMGIFLGFHGDPGRSVRKLESSPRVNARTAWMIDHLSLEGIDHAD